MLVEQKPADAGDASQGTAPAATPEPQPTSRETPVGVPAVEAPVTFDLDGENVTADELIDRARRFRPLERDYTVKAQRLADLERQGMGRSQIGRQENPLPAAAPRGGTPSEQYPDYRAELRPSNLLKRSWLA